MCINFGWTFKQKKMKKQFKTEVEAGLNRQQSIKPEILSEDDINHLPAIVQKYLKYVGAVGKDKVYNLKLSFEGTIRSKPTDSWMKLRADQYSFFDDLTRIFYIKATKKGIPAVGLHLYKNRIAIMVVKLLGLFKVVDARGKEMNQGETVTFLNDMCFMAPATLIDKRIEWNEIDEFTVEAKFTNGDITIGAKLYFKENGELYNFISTDRFETADGIHYYNYPWSTPTGDYKEIGGYQLASFAKTIYHRPDNDFCYGEFFLKSIEYNCNK